MRLTATIVNSAIAANSAIARAARSVFKTISPPYLSTSLICISHNSLACLNVSFRALLAFTPTLPKGGPLFLFATWRVKKANEEPRLLYKDACRARKFQYLVLFSDRLRHCIPSCGN